MLWSSPNGLMLSDWYCMLVQPSSAAAESFRLCSALQLSHSRLSETLCCFAVQPCSFVPSLLLHIAKFLESKMDERESKVGKWEKQKR